MDEDLLARLERKADHHTREAERYRVAAEVVKIELRGRTGTAAARRTDGDPRRSTMAMIETVLQQATSPLDLQTLTARMHVQGWQTESATPSNTVRTAVHRLVQRGVLQRNGHGLFSLAGAVDTSDTEPATTPVDQSPTQRQEPVAHPSEMDLENLTPA